MDFWASGRRRVCEISYLTISKGQALGGSELKRLQSVWSQTTTPAFYRKGKGYPLLIRLPFADDNRRWLQHDKRTSPVWNRMDKRWEVPKAWFNDLVARALNRYAALYVIQPYREQEKCAPACWNAQGHECQCSCMGANHGAGHLSGWLVVSDTFATRWGEEELACRLMTKR